MENMEFYGLLDFYPRKEEIKDSFDLLTLDERIMYKKYVYSIPFEEEYTKDLIWEFLNDWKESIFDLARKYRIKKKRNDKRQQLYDREKYESEHNVEVGQPQ